MRHNTIDIITLGCSKNLVDSERLMRQLEASGYHVTHDAERPKGEIAVINTCGFIGDAKEESINMILEFAQAKEEGRLKRLYVMGCLSERYLKELAIEIPQVDKFYGKFDWSELLEDLGQHYDEHLHIERTLTTPRHYAYLKISEGCDRTCSYCAIPIITGKHKSRPMEEILLWRGLVQTPGSAGVGGAHFGYPRCGVDSPALCLSGSFPDRLVSGDAGAGQCLQVYGHRFATYQ